MRIVPILVVLLIAGSLPAAATGTFDKAGNWVTDPPALAPSAQGAGAPVAEPLDYNKVCEAFGPGFVAVAGGTTCFKIGGYVKVGTSFGHVSSRPAGQ